MSKLQEYSTTDASTQAFYYLGSAINCGDFTAGTVNCELHYPIISLAHTCTKRVHTY